MNAAVLKFDRQDILVLHCIFAEAGKPRLSVKPRLVGGELHYLSHENICYGLQQIENWFLTERVFLVKNNLLCL